MSKLIMGVVLLAVMTVVGLLAAVDHRPGAEATPPSESPALLRQVSTAPQTHGSQTTETSNEDLHRMIDEANALIWSAHAAGGLEMQDAGFHRFPGVKGDIFTYGVSFAKFDLQGQYLCVEETRVGVRRDEVLTLGVEDTQVIESVTHPGAWDVMARFSPAISPYAKDRQSAREFALSNNWQPLDEGVALVHLNFVYGSYTYGEIHASMSANMGWVAVVKGTDINTANNIAAALLP